MIERAGENARRARDAGHVVIEGDATRSAVLEAANVAEAQVVVVAPSRDDTAVLTTLTAREMNPDATIASVVAPTH